MIITPDIDIASIKTNLDSYWEDGAYACGWKGCLFIPGIRMGIPSIEYFIRNLAGTYLPEAVPALKGVFFLVVCDKKKRVSYAFIDHSGLYKAFWTPRQIGTSFLELVQHLNLRVSNLDPEAVVEFFHLGGVYFNRTLMAGIRKIGHDEILTFSPNQDIRVIAKPLPALGRGSGTTLLDHFQSLAESFRYERISVDLTGGFDSRLVACLMAAVGMDFEVSLSGVEAYRDFAIARKVAGVLGKELQETHHQVDIRADDIHFLFRCLDGQSDVLTFHRLRQYHSDRRSRGMTLALSGVGGELYKDFWWLQDFPFYNLPEPKLKRLYNLRIEPLRFPHDLLGVELQEISRAFNRRMLQQLRCYVQDSNTKTYDCIYYYFKMQETAGCFTSSTINHFLNMYVPLLDRELVTIGYNLSRKQRFFNLYHRSQIQRLNPRAARLRTTEGVSASLAPGDLPMDIARYIGNRAKRVLKKTGQRLIARTHFQDSPDHPELQHKVYALPLTEQLLSGLKDHKILNPDLQREDLAMRLVGRIVTLGLMVDELN